MRGISFITLRGSRLTLALALTLTLTLALTLAQVCYAKAARKHARQRAKQAANPGKVKARAASERQGGAKRELSAVGDVQVREGKRERRAPVRVELSSETKSRSTGRREGTSPHEADPARRGDKARTGAKKAPADGGGRARDARAAPPPIPPVRESEGYRLYLAERGGVAGSHSTGYRGVHFRPHKALLQYECRAPPPLDGSGDGKNKRMFLGGFASAVEAAVCFAKHMESQGALVRGRGRGRGRGSIRVRVRR